MEGKSSMKAIRPPSWPPAVSGGRLHSGELSPPSAPAPLCQVSGESFAALGWRRRPTGEENTEDYVSTGTLQRLKGFQSDFM